jgi:hypothetical protein
MEKLGLDWVEICPFEKLFKIFIEKRCHWDWLKREKISIFHFFSGHFYFIKINWFLKFDTHPFIRVNSEHVLFVLFSWSKRYKKAN